MSGDEYGRKSKVQHRVRRDNGSSRVKRMFKKRWGERREGLDMICKSFFFFFKKGTRLLFSVVFEMM